jgi:hypothetical protein
MNAAAAPKTPRSILAAATFVERREIRFGWPEEGTFFRYSTDDGDEILIEVDPIEEQIRLVLPEIKFEIIDGELVRVPKPVVALAIDDEMTPTTMIALVGETDHERIRSIVADCLAEIPPRVSGTSLAIFALAMRAIENEMTQTGYIGHWRTGTPTAPPFVGTRALPGDPRVPIVLACDPRGTNIAFDDDAKRHSVSSISIMTILNDFPAEPSSGHERVATIELLRSIALAPDAHPLTRHPAWEAVIGKTTRET